MAARLRWRRPGATVGVKQLIAVEKCTYLLAAVGLAVAFLTLSRHATFSLAVGAALACANALFIRRLAQRLGAVLQQKPGLLVLLFNLKLALLIGLIFVAINWLGVDALPFVVGISMLPAAIFIVSIQHALALPSTTTPPSDEETHG